MDEAAFASRVNQAFHAVYHRGATRVADPRDLPSAETLSLLSHLAQAGPLTLSEMALHLHRSPSTLSPKVSALVSRGWLARQNDDSDGRSVQIWLSPRGREALAQATQVLDAGALTEAARRLSPSRRAEIVAALGELHRALVAGDEGRPDSDGSERR